MYQHLSSEIRSWATNEFMNTLLSSGFNYVIEFNQLEFDPAVDGIGTGGYGDVFKGKWLGSPVAIKWFGKKYVNKKALWEFITEIEVLHSLRHPNIVLYMGVSFDDKYQYYMITEYISRGSLFTLLHKQKLKIGLKRAY